MTIHELLAASGLTANDEIPIWDAEATGEPTKKITAQQLAAAVVALANLVTGVKGDKESDYRHSNVNLTPANIGAHPAQTDLQVTNNSSYTGTPAAAISKSIVQILDSSGFVRHQMFGIYNTSESFYTYIATRRPSGSSVVANQLGVGFDANGNGAYYVSYPLAFRLAIGATNTKVKGDAESSYRTGDVNLTPANIGAATKIKLTNSASSPELIYAELSKIPSGETATIYLGAIPFNSLTGKTGVHTLGTVFRNGTNRFDFNLMVLGGNASYGFTATVSSTSITPGTVYAYNGTVMS